MGVAGFLPGGAEEDPVLFDRRPVGWPGQAAIWQVRRLWCHGPGHAGASRHLVVRR
jgi:hypothetical protein